MNNITYDPFGKFITAGVGNDVIYEHFTYSNRGIPTSFWACTGGPGQCTSQTLLYTYAVNGSSGLAPNGDFLSVTDTVNGNWAYTYDDFNRLRTAVATNGQGCSWDYDQYGNRWHQNPYQGSCNAPMFSFTGNNNRIDGYTYDATGNLLNDGVHNYTYDAESRIIQVDGGNTASYVYDAEGKRIQKTTGGTAVDYLYDLDGHQTTEVGSGGTWNRGEVYAAGLHLATYWNSTTYFDFADWLGTERARVNLSGQVCETVSNLPFGDDQVISGSCSDSSSMHFTGKPFDSESNLGYFGARNYASSSGRFLSPDFINLTNERLMSPSNTLNKYTYAHNNPLTLVDPDGQDAVLFYDSSGPTGHVMLLAYNQSTGDYALEAYGPADGGTRSGEAIQVFGGNVDGVDDYKLPNSEDDLRQNYSSLTIQTTPEVAQDMINKIRTSYGNEPKEFNALYGRNCATSCSDVMKDLGITRQRTPAGLWSVAMRKYSKRHSWFPFTSFGLGTSAPHQNGSDYGQPRGPVDNFDLLWVLLHPPQACVTTYDSFSGTSSRSCQ
jgi:RHS repeat-associated protein